MARMLDFSGMQPADNSRGMDLLSSALERVIQRRHQKQLADEQAAASMKEKQLQDAYNRDKLAEDRRQANNTAMLREGELGQKTENDLAMRDQTQRSAQSGLLANERMIRALGSDRPDLLMREAPSLRAQGLDVQPSPPLPKGDEQFGFDTGMGGPGSLNVVNQHGDRITTMDPVANANAARRAAEGVARFDERSGSGAEAAAKRAVESAILAGESNSSTLAKIGDDARDKELSRESAERRARSVAFATSRRVADSGARTDRRDARTEWKQSVEDQHKVFEWKDKYKVVGESLEKIKSSNGLLTNQVLFGLAKANDSGRLTDQDFERSVGGADIVTTAKSWLTTKTIGDLSDSAKERVAVALRKMVGFVEARLMSAQEAGDDLAYEDPVYDDPKSRAYLQGRWTRTFGDLPWNQDKETRTVSPHTGAPKGGGASSSKTTGVRVKGIDNPESVVDSLLEKYKKK